MAEFCRISSSPLFPLHSLLKWCSNDCFGFIIMNDDIVRLTLSMYLSKQQSISYDWLRSHPIVSVLQVLLSRFGLGNPSNGRPLPDPSTRCRPLPFRRIWPFKRCLTHPRPAAWACHFPLVHWCRFGLAPTSSVSLAAQNLDLRLQLDALGTQLNLIVMVDGTINDWFCFFYNSWFDFSKQTILSFHNVKGNIITTTTEAADPAVLLPVINGVLTAVARRM